MKSKQCFDGLIGAKEIKELVKADEAKYKELWESFCAAYSKGELDDYIFIPGVFSCLTELAKTDSDKIAIAQLAYNLGVYIGTTRKALKEMLK